MKPRKPKAKKPKAKKPKPAKVKPVRLPPEPVVIVFPQVVTPFVPAPMC